MKERQAKCIFPSHSPPTKNHMRPQQPFDSAYSMPFLSCAANTAFYQIASSRWSRLLCHVPLLAAPARMRIVTDKLRGPCRCGHFPPQVPLFAAATAWDDPAEKLREDDGRLETTKAREGLSGTQWSPYLKPPLHMWAMAASRLVPQSCTVYFIVNLTSPPTLASFPSSFTNTIESWIAIPSDHIQFIQSTTP
jgi:hypothetical protein